MTCEIIGNHAYNGTGCIEPCSLESVQQDGELETSQCWKTLLVNQSFVSLCILEETEGSGQNPGMIEL